MTRYGGFWGYQTSTAASILGGPVGGSRSVTSNVVFALSGHEALHLWMLNVVSVSFAGGVRRSDRLPADRVKDAPQVGADHRRIRRRGVPCSVSRREPSLPAR